METETVIVRRGGGTLFTTFIVFLILKLVGVINWSWWFVTMPLWALPALAIGAIAIVFVFGVLWAIIEGIFT